MKKNQQIKKIMTIIGCCALCSIMLTMLFGPPGMWAFSKHTATLVDNLGVIEQAAQQYSLEDLHAFMEKWDKNWQGQTLCDLREDFNLLRLRRTYQGYYAVIPADSGEKLFVFMNWNLKIWNCFICTEFPSREQAYPLIQKVGGFGHRTKIPYCDLPTGAPYVAYYYTDGIEVVLYTDENLVTHEKLSPKTFYYLSSASKYNNALYILENGYLVPVIIDKDRQNGDASTLSNNVFADWGAIIKTGILMSLLFVFLNWRSLRKVFKALKPVDLNAGIKRYKRKWVILYFADVPLFLLGFWSSLTFGYPVSLFSAFVYLIIAIQIEKRQRGKWVQESA